jgi:HK97 family phage portal protein
MALFRRWANITADQYIPTRLPKSKHANVTPEQAMRHSAVWACLRLRANLISTLPMDVFRDVQGRPFQVPKPPVLANPDGAGMDEMEWRYSTQVDLDRGGNAYGIIKGRDSFNIPLAIQLVPQTDVTVEFRDGQVKRYRVGSEKYPPDQIWHEKQYTMAGLPVGLSPMAAAAWAIGEYLSIQEFASDWFSNSVVPAARLKHAHKTLDTKQTAEVKARYRESVSSGDLFVHGADWDFEMIGATASETNWLEAKEYSISDIARFFDCPGDLIDAAVQGGNLTYARVDTRQLQLLVNNLNPAIIRRERALSRLLPRPRYVKLNTKALLRLDAKTQAEIFKIEVDGRWRTPNQIRELLAELPLTETDYAEFDRLFGSRNPTPVAAAPQPELTTT